MKILLAALVLSALPAGASLKCANGGAPRLTGDLFAPVDCSSATLPVADLPVPPARPRKSGGPFPARPAARLRPS